jgi:WbqC-like protein family
VAGKRVAIVQSNYVPWRGYFDLIASVDEFVLLDDVQYTRRDWRNRNRIKTAQGTRWLTIPVQASGRYTQTIAETLVAEDDWATRHWSTVRQSYRNATGFAEAAFVEELYASVPGPSLSDVNRHFLEAICGRLEIATPLIRSHDYDPQGTKTGRLLDISRKAGARTYVSGPAAQAYLDEGAFAEHGIEVEWFEYGPYPEYEQPHPPFEPQVSILDTLLCMGAAAAEYVRPARVA